VAGVEVTVCIPTFNGQQHLTEVLEQIFGQRTDLDFEVLIIDSGSSDRTLEIVEGFPVRLEQIPNSEFGHGRTRNLALELARGDHVVFLTQDAIPAHDRWLQELVDAARAAPDVGASYGPHLPREDADPKTKRDLTEFFSGMGPPGAPTIQRKGDLTFLSDVNSCVSKRAWRQVPFRELPYAEDQALGVDLLDAGFTKAFAPSAAVVHSHSHPPIQYFQRMFDEWLGLKRAIGASYQRRLYKAVALAARSSFRDTRYITRLKTGSRRQRLAWALLAIWMDFTREITAYLAEHERRLPSWIKDRLSHERRLKRR
jgi:glycosyltransferase involved in cell wall biosynthesis